MAAAGSVLCEEQLLCPICLDLFDQPVSTPCGHNFCRSCIQDYWRIANLSQCPMCKQRFCRRPELEVNTFLSELAFLLKKSAEKTEEEETEAVLKPYGHKREVSCDVCVGKSVKALRSCLVCLASFCEIHLEPHRVLSTLEKHQLSDSVMNMQDRVCKKHDNLVNMFCKTDQTPLCQVCIKQEHGAHHTVSVEEESRATRAQVRVKSTELEEMINSRMQKISEISRTVQLSRQNTEREIEESLRVFNKLIPHVQRGRGEVVELIEAKQRQVESRASRVTAELQREIDVLRQRIVELEQLLQTEDDLYLVQSFPALAVQPVGRVWSESCVETAVYVGTLRRAVSRAAHQLEEAVQAEVKRLGEAELRRAQEFATDVTLDPDTAHPKLVLSEDRKQVHHGDVALSVPDNPERFYPGVSVLGKEGFSSGRFYFEVQVKGKTEWDVGVALGSVNRKGGNTLNPESGYWALGMRKEWSCWALASSPVCLPVGETLHRVGVYADLEWGQISFYNVDDASHVYSFTGFSFSGRLFPFFNPRRNHCGVNSAPLIIPPVK